MDLIDPSLTPLSKHRLLKVLIRNENACEFNYSIINLPQGDGKTTRLVDCEKLVPIGACK